MPGKSQTAGTAVRRSGGRGAAASNQADRLEIVRGEDRLEVRVAQVLGDQFAEHVAEVRGVQEVALLVKLLGQEARPAAQDVARAVGARREDRAAHREHAVGPTWSVPPVPFSAAVRPKSLSVTTSTSSKRFSRSAAKAASASAKPPTRLAYWPPLLPPWFWWVSQLP